MPWSEQSVDIVAGTVEITGGTIDAVIDTSGGPVQTTGNVTITGTPTVDIASGSVDITSGTVTVDSVTNTVETQSNAQVLYSHAVPSGGGVMPNVVSIPPWVRAVYLITNGTFTGEGAVTLIGVTSGIIYANVLPVGDIAPPIQCIPIVGVADTALTVNITQIGGTLSGNLIVIAIPDLGIAPVQNLPNATFNVSNLPKSADTVYSQSISLTGTPQTIIGGIPTIYLTLWTMYLDNASGTTGTVTLQTTNGVRVWAGVLPNAANIVIPFAGVKLARGLGLQLLANNTGVYHPTITYGNSTS